MRMEGLPSCQMGIFMVFFTQKTPRNTFVETFYSFGTFVWETERTEKGNLLREKREVYEKFWKRGEEERVLVSYKKMDGILQKTKSFGDREDLKHSQDF